MTEKKGHTNAEDMTHQVYVLILNHDSAHYTEEQLKGLTQVK